MLMKAKSEANIDEKERLLQRALQVTSQIRITQLLN